MAKHDGLEKAARRLPPVTRYWFRQFAVDGQVWNWHPLDQEKFCRFVRAAHLGRVKLPGAELEKMLRECRFTRMDARDLAMCYDVGRMLLRIRHLRRPHQ